MCIRDRITPYSAPEVRSGDAVLSETMDIYSVGVILYEVYNGGELPLDEQNKLIQTCLLYTSQWLHMPEM